MDTRNTSGQIQLIRKVKQDDLDAVCKFISETPTWADPEVKPILATEGWMSRKSKDRMGDIIEPRGWVLDAFLQNPILLLGHNHAALPIGIWTEVSIHEDGLYGKNLIFDTAVGREVALLIRAGVIRANSVGFDPLEWSITDDGYHFTKQELLECSIVSVPAHADAVIQGAEAKQIDIENIKKHIGFQEAGVKKGFSIVEDIKKDVAQQGERVKDVEVKAGELGREFDKMAQIQNELVDAVKSGKTSTAEMKTLVDRVQSDFVKAQKELNDKISKVKSRKTINTGMDLQGLNIKSLVMREPAELKAQLPPQTVDNILALQRQHDDVVLLDAMLALSSKNHQGRYHQEDRETRIKSLNAFTEFNAFAKAMDSETSGEGADWVPTDMSGSLIESVKLELKLATLFDEIIMPTGSFTLDTEGDDTFATLAGQKTTLVSGFDSIEQTPGTDSITLVSKKCRSRYQISTELTEDSAIAIMPYARNKLVNGIARSEDRAILNGDNTTGGTATFDSGYTVATTDFRHAWDGLRYHWFETINSGTAGSVSGIDMGTFDLTNLGKIRGQMGKYGLYPASLANICGIQTYLLRFLLDIEEIRTLKDYGPKAVVLSGQLADLFDVPIIISEFAEETQDGSGIYSGAGYARGSVTTVNRKSWLRGVRRGIEVLSERDIINDVYNLVAFKRMDFKPTVTPASTDIIVNVGYNVDCAS